MTNFDTLKNGIWDAAKSDDKAAFDAHIETLKEKSGKDIWRIGWSVDPNLTIDKVYKMLDDVAKWCHERWLEAMECGDAPSEDVSPAEGILFIENVQGNPIPLGLGGIAQGNH